MIIRFFGEAFYQRVRDNIPIDNNVTLRVVDQMHLIYSAYGQDLTRYVDFTNSTSNIGQESARYSNINDGLGLGIFSTRSRDIRIMQLSEQSGVELADGQCTCDLKF
ncbi:MAG: hypothetical protein ACI8XB_001812 [Patiriisocius sp.]|jgi:hypothetical protein